MLRDFAAQARVLPLAIALGLGFGGGVRGAAYAHADTSNTDAATRSGVDPEGHRDQP